MTFELEHESRDALDASRNRHIELLAPAGDEECAIAALANGADAIYLGLGEFNARRNAENLSIDELTGVCELAHRGAQRVYLTLNTLMLESEMACALELAARAWDAGVDALIVQDIGLLRMLCEALPEIEVHASTQMNIHTAAGVRLAGELGASRVTLARELSLGEIAKLASIGPEIEIFCHGALCVCHSGQCLMSSLIGRRSANRGLCAQPCRLPYELVRVGEGANLAEEAGAHLLSPKDLCLAGMIGPLFDANVASLKIEGRMKSKEYVATVVRVYRGIIDRVLAERGGEGAGARAGSVAQAPTAREMLDLSEAFSRGFTTAYVEGDDSMAIMSAKRPNNRGVAIGRVKDIRDGLVRVSLEQDLLAGDVLEFFTAGGSVLQTISSMRVGGKESQSAAAGDVASLLVTKAVAPGDRVFRVRSARLSKLANESTDGFCGRPIPVRVRVKCVIGSPLEIELDGGGGFVGIAQGDIVEAARTRAVTRDDIKEHVGRLGGTNVVASSWDIELLEGASVRFGELHSVRREAVDSLMAKVMGKYAGRGSALASLLGKCLREHGSASDSSPKRRAAADLMATCEVCVLASPANAEGLLAAARHERVILPALALTLGSVEEKATLSRAFEAAAGRQAPIGLYVPNVCHDGDEREAVLSCMAQAASNSSDCLLVCDNLELLREGAAMGQAWAGPHVNALNDAALMVLCDLGASGAWLSHELSLSQVRGLCVDAEMPLGLAVYGAQKLMVTQHCAIESQGGCSGDCANCMRRGLDYRLRDRKGYEFPVRSDCMGRGHVYNSVALDLAPNIADLAHAGITRFFVDASLLPTGEAVSAMGRISVALKAAQEGAPPVRKIDGCTTGHLFRGVI